MFVILVHLLLFYSQHIIWRAIWDTLFSRHNLVWIFLSKMVICFFIHSSTHPSIHLFIYLFYPVFLSFLLFPSFLPFPLLSPSCLHTLIIHSFTPSNIDLLVHSVINQLISTPLLPAIFLFLPSSLFPSFLLFPFFHIPIFFVSLSFFLSLLPFLTSFFPSLAPFISPLAILHSP